MSTQSVPDQFKVRVGMVYLWGGKNGGRLLRMVPRIFSNRLVELAHIKPGDKVLDIATGIGEPAITGAKRVGSSGHVMATDISPQMLSIARQRAASMGLENIMGDNRITCFIV